MATPLTQEFRTPLVDKNGQVTGPWQRLWGKLFCLTLTGPNVIARPQFNLPVYANNAAALAGGLEAGDLYRTGGDPDPVCIVH